MKKKIGDNNQQKEIRRFIFSLLKNYKLRILLTFVLSVVFVVFSLYIPILAGRAIDSIAGQGKVIFADVKLNVIKIIIFALIAASSQWLMSIINNGITYNTVRDLRKKVFEKLMRVPIAFTDKTGSGSIVSRLISDIDSFADGLLMGFTQLFTGVITVIGTLCFMLAMNPAITAAVVLLTPLSLFAAKFIAGKTYSMFKLQSERRADQTGFTDEMIGNMKTVKAFSYENSAARKFDEINKSLSAASLRATFYSSLTNPVTRFVNSVVYMAVALFGALAAVSGALSIGMLVSFLAYANQYTKPFNEISGVITELQNAVACAGRVLALLNEDEVSPEGELHADCSRGTVEFKHVDFSYTENSKLIENFSFKANPGEKIAIVGPTGCGKTTLINLLMRFYDVDSGEILVNGVNINDISRKELRSNFGMVLQETWLQTATVRENLKLGAPDISDDEMISAAKLTHAHGFIKRLEHGYDTVIGENGSSLSEGQKQLLCITRVMLTESPMLILDEATSSIDTRTELIVQRAFDLLMKGKTSFVVAHRLSTVTDADKIIVMKDGKIIETGTHLELLNKNGFYADLFNSQFKTNIA